MDDTDRGAILRRRALFLGSALAALGGCARGAPPAENAPETVVVPPANSEDEDAGVEPDAGAPPKRNSGGGSMPSLDVPSGVSDAARRNYERMATTFTTAHKNLDELEGGIPSCPISDASCEGKWRTVAEQHYNLENAFRFFHICPGSSADAKAYAEREQAHRAYFEERRKLVQAKLDAALGSGGKQRFEQMVNDARRARPVPCLSFACTDW